MPCTSSRSAPTPELPARRLAALRAELDRIDDALHDQLMGRAELVAEVAALGAKGRVPLRPGREASIIRRLLARNRGPLANATVVRIWRELLAGSSAQQNDIQIAVCGGAELAALAREHFGALTPVLDCAHLGEVCAEIQKGLITAAVVRQPRNQRESREEPPPWWIRVFDNQGLNVVARLPFWRPRRNGVPEGDAFVVSAAPPDPSGDDRSLLGLRVAAGTAPQDLRRDLAAAGFAPSEVLLSSARGTHALADVQGFVAEDDARLGAVGCASSPPRVLGAYAVPFGAPE